MRVNERVEFTRESYMTMRITARMGFTWESYMSMRHTERVELTWESKRSSSEHLIQRERVLRSCEWWRCEW